MVFFHLNCISQIVVAGPENEKITCGAKYTYDIVEKKELWNIYVFVMPHRFSSRIATLKSDRIYTDWKLTDVAAS